MVKQTQLDKFSAKELGSSLIGVAMLTLIMGFLMSGGTYLIKTYNTIKADQKTVDVSKSLTEAIKDFVAINKRYPCPARFEIAPDMPNFGIEDCSIIDVNGRDSIPVKIGTAPVRTLNVPDKMMIDGYGKRHIYAVTTPMTSNAPLPDLVNTIGAIFINDEFGQPVSNAPGQVVYTIISPGKDDRGAYNVSGQLLEACGDSIVSPASENCNGDAIFLSSTVKNFSGGVNTFTHNFAFKGSDLPYNWKTSSWSICGEDRNGDEWSSVGNNTHPRPVCFASFQERTVECKDRRGGGLPAGANELDDQYCGHTPQPESNRSCSIGPCNWGTQNALCLSGFGPTVPVSVCTPKTEVIDAPSREIACPYPQTGSITVLQQQSIIRDANCNTRNGPVTEVSRQNNCVQPSCTSGLEGNEYRTRTEACPTGQTGQITISEMRLMRRDFDCSISPSTWVATGRTDTCSTPADTPTCEQTCLPVDEDGFVNCYTVCEGDRVPTNSGYYINSWHGETIDNDKYNYDARDGDGGR